MQFFKDHWLGIFISGVLASLVASFIYARLVQGGLPNGPRPTAAIESADPQIQSPSLHADHRPLSSQRGSALPHPMPDQSSLNRLAIGAAKTKDWNSVENLIVQGADVNSRDENGEALIFMSLAWPAAARENTELSAPRMLIRRGADVNLKMPDCISCARPNLGVPTVAGFTPLHYAAWAGDLPLTQLLVGAGANLDPTDDQGRTPLYSAIDLGQYDVAQYLVEHGASAASAIQIANNKGDADVKRWLNEHGFPN